MSLAPSDRDRFACCFLNKANQNAIDWDAAAAAQDPGVKTASFKTMASKAAKKAAGSRQGCSSTDLDRFAYCFIHASDRTDVDWDKASNDFNPKTKTASFKTITAKAVKKLGQLGNGAKTDGGDADGSDAKPKAKRARKRKADDDDGAEGEVTAPKTKRAKAEMKKKVLSEEPVDYVDDDDDFTNRFEDNGEEHGQVVREGEGELNGDVKVVPTEESKDEEETGYGV